MLIDKTDKAGRMVIALAITLGAPAVTAWAINSLAEAGGSNFYLEHDLSNYVAILLLLMLFRGGKWAS